MAHIALHGRFAVELPLILSGPILRRVESGLVSVWVALSKACSVQLSLFEGLAKAGDTPKFSRDADKIDTIAVGDKLHLAVVMMKLTGADVLKPGQLYSYNISLTEKTGGAKHDLKSLGLLQDNVLSTTPPETPTQMAFINDVNAAIADAKRGKDVARLSALRMLKAALMNREVERGRALDDSESRQVVSSLVKQRKDSIEQFTKGGRQDLVDKEAAEIRVLESYLPPSADPAAIELAVLDAIAETAATSAKDMGRVMKTVMAKLAGQSVDGKVVNELVRQKLAGS